MLYTITNGGLQNGRPTSIGLISIPVANGSTHTYTVANFTTETFPAYSDPEGDSLSYIKILSLPAKGSISVVGIIAQVISVGSIVSVGTISSGNLLYTPMVNAKANTGTFTFDAADLGSNSLSGLSTGVVNMNVADEVNLKPSTVGDNTINKQYSESHVFTSAEFTTNTTPAYSDPEGDLPESIKILSLPLTGVLSFNGSNVIVNQVLKSSEIELGYLVYTPDLTTTIAQTLTFNFSVSDVGSGLFTE
jgi:hypothetical protein